jgi:hypothetical protein
MYLATVRSEISKPRLRSSPWILGAPQPAFSMAMVRITFRISALIFGRPPRVRDRQRQYKRKPDRCHRMTLSGFPMARTPDHRGHTCRKVLQKNRSKRVSGGFGRWRLRNAICCRKALERSVQAPAEESADRQDHCRDQRARSTTL